MTPASTGARPAGRPSSGGRQGGAAAADGKRAVGKQAAGAKAAGNRAAGAKAAGKKAAGATAAGKKAGGAKAAGKKAADGSSPPPRSEPNGAPTGGPTGGPEAGGAPAARRALRNQGRRTMRKLLDAAMVAFDRRGYHATRVNDVVEIAKTSHGTFYLYFSNKEDLLRALVSEASAEAAGLYSAMADPPSGGTDWEDLREWVGRYSALWTRYAPLLRAWTDLAAIDPELGDQVRRAVGAMSGAIAARIQQGRRSGTVDGEVAGMAVVAMLDRFHYLREFTGRPVDGAALDTLTTMVHRALFSPG